MGPYISIQHNFCKKTFFEKVLPSMGSYYLEVYCSTWAALAQIIVSFILTSLKKKKVLYIKNL